MPLFGIIAAKINSCMAQYMSGAQKEQEYQRSETRARDRAVAQDCKSRLTNLCTASIDYKPMTRCPTRGSPNA